MGHIYLSHSHTIAIYACPIPWDVSNGMPIGMTFPWTSLRLCTGHIYLSYSHPIAIYVCPAPSHPMGRFQWDSHRNDIPMDKPRVVHGTYLSVPFPSHSNLCERDCVCEGLAVLTRQRNNETVALLRNNSIVHTIR